KKEAKGSKLTLNPDDGKIESRFLSEGGLASLPGLAIFKKIYAAILFGLISVLENKIILYPVLFFIIYKLIRLVFRRMTRNRKPLS
ncbi:hypothetical protein HY061_01795, partial [Candidatus Azambacteria bacterium]|nr:hypothetical protein [Candidatus Azambacteria bacterium]